MKMNKDDKKTLIAFCILLFITGLVLGLVAQGAWGLLLPGFTLSDPGLYERFQEYMPRLLRAQKREPPSRTIAKKGKIMSENAKKASDMLLEFMKKSIEAFWEDRAKLEDLKARGDYDFYYISRISDIGMAISKLEELDQKSCTV